MPRKQKIRPKRHQEFRAMAYQPEFEERLNPQEQSFAPPPLQLNATATAKPESPQEEEVQLKKATSSENTHEKGCGCGACSGRQTVAQQKKSSGSGLISQAGSEAKTSQQKNTSQPTTNQGVIQRGFWGRLWKGIKKVGRKISGGFKKAGKWIGRTAKKAWKGLKKAGRWIGRTAKKAWRGIKKFGRWIGKGAKIVWNGIKWVSKKLWEKTKGIFHRVKRWIVKLPSRVKRLVVHLWKGVKSLKPWSLKWWKSLGKASTWKNFGKWLGEFLIHGAEVMGVAEIAETIADFIKFNTRPLTGSEIAVAREVFGNSIDYNLVRIDEKAITAKWSNAAYVTFHTINHWGALSPSLLIHELTHVWQYEKMGAMYMPRAIHAQGTPEGYDYGGIPQLEANQNIGMNAFNLEQQGDLLRDYYLIKHNQTPQWSTFDEANRASVIALFEIYVNEVKAR